ncbi:hypothetical protein AAG570_006308 [Ranatra chinensis]|uniref:Uncharacterized protein n=1 Tax=Ranatra chinensis TaxID=642074 RepID=A0ABD0YTP9_9HEMI
MVEANKAKLAAASTVPLPRVALGQGILGYLSKNKQNQPSSTPAAQEKPPAEKPPLDIASQKGKFGWIMLGEEHIPYIIRGEDKYCAVRMVELKLLAKYLNYLNADIYSCTCIRSYYITEAEARLLTEINIKHCECRFGREQFSVKDLVVRLQDASEFYNFLDLCYTKLLNPLSNTKERCGFIRINCDSVVPYTIKDGKQYVPLFYFEGETDNLKQKADKLESWDLAYLKFCCKVQGIRSELFASETCSVISLADIKSYFPHGTVFDEYWPPKVMDSQLLITPKNSGARTWLKVPPGAATTPTSSAIVPNKDPIDTRIVSNCQVSNGWPSIPGNQQRYQSVATTQQPRLQATPISMHSVSIKCFMVTFGEISFQFVLPYPYKCIFGLTNEH